MFRKPAPKEPQSEAEKRQQALVTAGVVIADNRAKLKKPMEQYQSVANSTYWFYGYVGGSMMTAMACALGIGSRFQVVGRYASWVALIGGYYGGQMLHGLHNNYNLQAVLLNIDNNIAEMKRLDEKNNHQVQPYINEIQTLTKMRHELAPDTKEAQEEAAKATVTAGASLDQRVDDLLAAYERRKALKQ
mmetsp:Transcript_21308/g.24767  ORF Transcript_21308/g.24767 Transcript_21308/m.24767 type:complete len:189 (-) Transcript_21308:42-608(-)